MRVGDLLTSPCAWVTRGSCWCLVSSALGFGPLQKNETVLYKLFPPNNKNKRGNKQANAVEEMLGVINHPPAFCFLAGSWLLARRPQRKVWCLATLFRAVWLDSDTYAEEPLQLIWWSTQILRPYTFVLLRDSWRDEWASPWRFRLQWICLHAHKKPRCCDVEAKAGNLRARFQSDDQIRDNTASAAVSYRAFTCGVNVFRLSHTACWSAVKSNSFNCFA